VIIAVKVCVLHRPFRNSEWQTRFTGQEFADDANLLLEEGVTDNAPYSNTSDYKMVEYSLETDKSDKNIQNYQSS